MAGQDDERKLEIFIPSCQRDSSLSSLNATVGPCLRESLLPGPMSSRAQERWKDEQPHLPWPCPDSPSWPAEPPASHLAETACPQGSQQAQTVSASVIEWTVMCHVSLSSIGFTLSNVLLGDLV